MSDLVSMLSDVPADLAEEVARLVRPCALMKPIQEAPSSPVSSSFLGHPFVPEDSDLPWPTDQNGAPMLFLVQVNFAEVPALPGFPREGMLQWFCGTDDTSGLTFDGTDQGIAGLHARWWSAQELARPALSPLSATTPVVVDHEEVFSPAEVEGPLGIEFSLAPSLPGWDDATAAASDAYSDALAEEELVVPSGHKVGGYPDFVQSDPRERYPDRAPTLLLELGWDDVFMWGDAGTAQLFGDPEALARGDLSSLWWDWACG